MVNTITMDVITNEPNYLKTIVDKCSDLLETSKNSFIIFFGAGEIGVAYLNYFRSHNVAGRLLFCDNDSKKKGTTLEGVPIISFDELATTYNESYIIITSFRYSNEIFDQLKENNLYNNLVDPSLHNIIGSDVGYYLTFQDYLGIVNKNLIEFQAVFDLLADDYSRKVFHERINYCISGNPNHLIPLKSKSAQYFESDIVSLSANEVFVDGGAYTGDTLEEFLDQTGGRYRKIYAFEPEELKRLEFQSKFANHPHIELSPYGLWSQRDLLRFNALGSEASGLSENGNIEVPVTSLDEVLQGEPVSFIKMDIEGAELEALRGAERTIREYKPKLAICVYHKPLDIVQVPLYLSQLVPDYKFFIRHYSNGFCETVCYAIAEQKVVLS